MEAAEETAALRRLIREQQQQLQQMQRLLEASNKSSSAGSSSTAGKNEPGTAEDDLELPDWLQDAAEHLERIRLLGPEVHSNAGEVRQPDAMGKLLPAGCTCLSLCSTTLPLSRCERTRIC